MPIHLLSPDIVSKIAAGEVIERPCYALKELIENSIDAQATQIDIEASNVGLDHFAVIDNGKGMSQSDLLLAPQRHTTSKIQTSEELSAIHTLGFRGEALASIASVSAFTLRSRTTQAKAGYSLHIFNSQVQDQRPLAMDFGTQVIVDQLFNNLPARKKFLRNKATEYRYLIDIITNLSLAHPAIAFSFSHNDRRILTLPSQSLESRAQLLLGQDTYSNLVPINHQDDLISISGFVGKPQIATHTPQKQYLYVNNRRILSPLIANTVRQAYGTLLESASQPVFVLFLKLRPEQIDVNVHPRKEAIYLLNQTEVLETLFQTVKKSLTDHNLTQIDARWQYDNLEHNLKSYLHTHLKHTVDNHTADILREKVLTPYYGSRLKVSADITQLHNMYLVTETRDGILLVDQHAAHERILYEKFLQAFEEEKSKGESYQLPKPLDLNLSFSDHALLMQHWAQFNKLGFKLAADLDAATDNHPKVTHVPLILKDHPIPRLLTELLDDLRESAQIKLDTRSHRMLSYLACRSAIMAGDKLSKERMKSLLDELSQCKTEYTCPHGRPAKVEIPLKSMHKLFKRV